jgi:hypothetical protein
MLKLDQRPKLQPMSADDAKRMSDLFDKVTQNFKGGMDELESSIGMYVLGRHFGWKVLYIVHSKKTVAKYESILGIDVRKEFPEEGNFAEVSIGYRIAKGFSNFWKVVSGEEKIDRASRREIS